MSAKSCPAENTGPSAARISPSAGPLPTSATAWTHSRRCSSESAFRRSGRRMRITTNGGSIRHGDVAEVQGSSSTARSAGKVILVRSMRPEPSVLRSPLAERPEIHQIVLPDALGRGPVQVYLVESEPLTLIDTGVRSPASRAALEAALESLGHGLEDVRRVLLTHFHGDHLGPGPDAAPRLARARGLVPRGRGRHVRGVLARARREHRGHRPALPRLRRAGRAARSPAADARGVPHGGSALRGHAHRPPAPLGRGRAVQGLLARGDPRARAHGGPLPLPRSGVGRARHRRPRDGKRRALHRELPDRRRARSDTIRSRGRRGSRGSRSTSKGLRALPPHALPHDPAGPRRRDRPARARDRRRAPVLRGAHPARAARAAPARRRVGLGDGVAGVAGAVPEGRSRLARCATACTW